MLLDATQVCNQSVNQCRRVEYTFRPRMERLIVLLGGKKCLYL